VSTSAEPLDGTTFDDVRTLPTEIEKRDATIAELSRIICEHVKADADAACHTARTEADAARIKTKADADAACRAAHTEADAIHDAAHEKADVAYRDAHAKADTVRNVARDKADADYGAIAPEKRTP